MKKGENEAFLKITYFLIKMIECIWYFLMKIKKKNEYIFKG